MPIEPYYSEGGITIYHGDCREILPTLGRFDVVIMDPPYGIGETTKRQKSRQGHGLANQRDYGEYEWDNSRPPRWLVDMAIDSGNAAIVWGGNYFELPPSTCWLVWDKDNGETDFADCELAWTNIPKAVRRFKWKWQGMLQERAGDKKELRQHPTQKPLPLMQWCIKHAGPDAKTILDPFAGSCTTGVAAKLEGRQATLIEINERYCEIGANRLRQGVLDFGE